MQPTDRTLIRYHALVHDFAVAVEQRRLARLASGQVQIRPALIARLVGTGRSAGRIITSWWTPCPHSTCRRADCLAERGSQTRSRPKPSSG